MAGRLLEIKDYEYYFQFTITPYGKDIEPNLPDKKIIVETFKKLSCSIGPDKIILRYDPILINKKYHFDYHLRAFEKITNTLRDFTRAVTISFIDEKYRGVKANVKELELIGTNDDERLELCRRFAEIARGNGLIIKSCAGKPELTQFGIEPARCIDAAMFKHKNFYPLTAKDKNQRPECGCAPSIDIGAYNTCVNGCRYCYANYIQKTAEANFLKHDPKSPLITGIDF